MLEISIILAGVITLILLKIFLNVDFKKLKKLNIESNGNLSDITDKISKINQENMCKDILKELYCKDVKVNVAPEYNSCLYTIFNNTITIGKFKEEYELDSPYLIKVLPSKKSNYRARKMTTKVLRDRLENIRFLLFLNLGKNVVLTPVSLFYSGIMSDMHEKQLEDNKEWDILSLGEYLELRGYYVNCFELYNEYCNKYIPKKIVTEYNWS